MWNVRNVLRQVSVRLKTTTQTTGKESRTELEDEYKLWTSNLWGNDLFSSKATRHASENAGLLFASTKKSKKKSGKDSSDSERHDWHASDIQSSPGWLEALGWGAALGLGLNILQLRQDEQTRLRTVEKDGQGRFSPRWFTNVAFSMPYMSGQPGLIRSVLPASSSDQSVTDSRNSVSLEYSTSDTDFSETGSSHQFSDYQKPSYTSETAVMMSLLRQQLTDVAADYVGALQNLLSPRATDGTSADSDRFRKAQEEYNMGLFHELGISVSRNSDKAFKHYVEAALLEHPVAIQNIVSFHIYASAFPESQERRASMQRCFSSPALSRSDSGRDSVASADLDADEPRQNKRKFWTSSDEDSRSSSGLSRSSSFPDFPRAAVTCV